MLIDDGILIQDEGFGVQDINTCAFAKQQKLTFDVPIKISMVDITISRGIKQKMAMHTGIYLFILPIHDYFLLLIFSF